MGGKLKQVKVIPKLHPRNKHQGRYDLKALIDVDPELKPYVRPNLYGDESIDFADPKAVKELNKALLKLQYGIDYWEVPEKYLCPPIPGRADYIHHFADWLCSNNFGKIPKGDKFTCLDIGVGASAIYPIIGRSEYEWSFIGSDIDEVSLESAQKIVDQNDNLKGKVELRLQKEKSDILYGVITMEEKIDFSVCNPPFHSSAYEAQKGSQRKVKNLSEGKAKTVILNFGGQPNELWCDGGESKFIKEYIRQSKNFAESVFWFSTLVSKQSHIRVIEETLNKAGVTKMSIIPMGQGNKASRIITWTFLTKEQQKLWKASRWK
ncbi:MAG: 23S rRNA (adenine(1618)-N(6))-methyltransferase RlmF [Reichenbachiella sp.]